MLPTMPGGHWGAPRSPIRIGAGATPSLPSAVLAQSRPAVNSRRRLSDTRSTISASCGKSSMLGGSVNVSALDTFLRLLGANQRDDVHSFSALLACCLLTPNGTTASGATRSTAAGSATSAVPQNWQFADSSSLSVCALQSGQTKAVPSLATGLAGRRASSANACSRTAAPTVVAACRFPQWPHAITPAAGSQAMVDPQFWHGYTVVPLVMLNSPRRHHDFDGLTIAAKDISGHMT